MTAIAKGPVLILGARSDIGRALAHEYARHGHTLYLAARQAEHVTADCRDLGLRHGIDASAYACDVAASATHRAFLDSLPALPATVILVAGLMTDQKAAEEDFPAAEAMIRTNYLGPVSLLNAFASRMEQRGEGSIIAISSIAGERGRAANYIYGSSKAGLTAFMSGLGHRLSAKGVHVLCVKPGFVRTKMTQDMRLPPLLTATPEALARRIYRAHQRRKTELYSSFFWRMIACLYREMPSFLLYRTKI